MEVPEVPALFLGQAGRRLVPGLRVGRCRAGGVVRENAMLKARRLLVEARVRVRAIDETNGGVRADVRGDSGQVYAVTYQAGMWRCDCDARGPCSHMRAVMLIVVVNPTGRS
jgi:hypothetical protein